MRFSLRRRGTVFSLALVLLLAFLSVVVQSERRLPGSVTLFQKPNERTKKKGVKKSASMSRQAKKVRKRTRVRENMRERVKSRMEATAVAGAVEAVPPMEPALPGVLPGMDRPKLLFAADTDYPPFAMLGTPADDFPLTGFAVEFAKGLEDVCDVDVYTLETRWTNCWDAMQAGQGLMNGWHHACMSYTHTTGVRNRFLEFSDPILNDNQRAGIITRLDKDGNPVIDGSSNLEGVKVVDVVGWAPTADTLAVSVNSCTGELFSGYEVITPTVEDTGNANDNALLTLLNGDADAMWIYASQADEYSCDKVPAREKVAYDCTLWDRLGKDFAYIHVGMKEHTRAGTTLAMGKLGAGVADMINPCIKKFLRRKKYFKLCKKYELVDSCFPNRFFPQNGEDVVKPTYEFPTNEVSTKCKDGYCACPKNPRG